MSTWSQEVVCLQGWWSKQIQSLQLIIHHLFLFSPPSSYSTLLNLSLPTSSRSPITHRVSATHTDEKVIRIVVYMKTEPKADELLTLTNQIPSTFWGYSTTKKHKKLHTHVFGTSDRNQSEDGLRSGVRRLDQLWSMPTFDHLGIYLLEVSIGISVLRVLILHPSTFLRSSSDVVMSGETFLLREYENQVWLDWSSKIMRNQKPGLHIALMSLLENTSGQVTYTYEIVLAVDLIGDRT